jgi:hypothetical protein
MSEPWTQDLEAQLQQMAAQLSWPSTPDLAASAGAELADHPVRQPRRLPKVLLAAAVVVAVLGASLATSRSVRRAVSELLGLPGVKISTGPPPSIPSTTRPRTPLDLGQPVSLADASRRVGFTVRVPALSGFDQPDGVYVSTPPPEGQAALMYRPRPDLPASPQTGVGLLVTEFKGTMEAGFFGKVSEPGTTIEAVAVHHQPAYWLSGAPHAFFYSSAKGDIFPDTLRLATNTLVWQSGSITLRLEGQIPKERALAIAESIS